MLTILGFIVVKMAIMVLDTVNIVVNMVILATDVINVDINIITVIKILEIIQII